MTWIEVESKCFPVTESIKSFLCGYNVISNFSSRIIKGDKIGILGDNGSGKSTLIKLILGEITADSGEVSLGTNLDIAYFDQTRDKIDPNKSVGDNIADGNEFVVINGKQRHVISYLQDFLFTPDRIRTPASALSGGEFSRLMLAQLFSKSTNLLIMDEPTNDLDLATLELLEQQIADYKGTLILVSHDRAFIDNTVTSLICLDGSGAVDEFVGGYTDWFNYNASLKKQVNQKQAKTVNLVKSKEKLSYKEQRELEQIPVVIADLESQTDTLQKLINSTDFFNQDANVTQPKLEKLSELEAEIAELYTRWESLD